MNGRPLWRCPRCGHRYVTRNIWHSCSRRTVAGHLRGKPRAVVGLYRAFGALVRENGPVHVYAQRTRIVYQVRTRFAGVALRRRWIDVAFWLKRRIDDPRLRVEFIARRDHVHHRRVTRPEELDLDLRRWIAEAYAVGAQRAPSRAPR